jgi:hypothetical protein
MASYERDPDSAKDYQVDWSSWLVEGDIITAHQLIVAPPDGLVVTNDSHDATTVTYWVSGGEVGSVTKVTCRITTTVGRIDDRTDTFITRHQ